MKKRCFFILLVGALSSLTLAFGVLTAANAEDSSRHAFSSNSGTYTEITGGTVHGTANTSTMSLTDPTYPAPGLVYSLLSGVEIIPEKMSKAACEDSDTVYEVAVWNHTGVIQSFNLDYVGAWPSTGPAATGNIPNDGSATITVSVHIPRAAKRGDKDDLTITASDPSGTYTDTATATTIAGPASGYTDLANVPSGREVRYHSVVYWDGKLYKIGGYSGAAQAWVDIYDISTDRWTSGSDMPGARYWMDCEAIAGKIYCAGGYLTSGQSTLYIYDIGDNSWTTGTALPASRYRYASVALGGKYYVIGGNTGVWENTMLVYDPDTTTWNSTLASMTAARGGQMAGVIGGKIYVAGGYDGSGISSAEVYDPVANSWAPVASLPLPWCNAGDAVIDDRFLVILGGYGTDATASLYAYFYDATNDVWAALPNMNHYLYGTAAAGNGAEVWNISGRLYEGLAWSYSPYTTHMDLCVSVPTGMPWIPLLLLE